MPRTVDDPALSQVEAFELLGNQTRLAIIQALAEQRRVNWRWEGMGFAELRKAVGVRDAGTFNYHLDELRGYFVVKDGDEYVLNQRGLSVADAVLAGMYGSASEERRAKTDLRCQRCGDALTAVYDDGTLLLVCERHDVVVGTAVPPGAVANRELDEVVDIAFRDMQQDVERARAGVCMHCWGRMEGHLSTSPGVEHPVTGDPIDGAGTEDPPTTVFGCQRCEMVFWTEPFGAILREPSVVAFFHDHGIDVGGLAFVDERLVTAFDDQTVLEDGRLSVSLSLETDRLTVTIDEQIRVDDVQRDRD